MALSSSPTSSKSTVNIETPASQAPDIIFGFPCYYHKNIEQLLNKDVVIKCEFKVDTQGLLYHAIHFKNMTSAKLITQLTSCRYVLGYDGNIVTLYELISAILVTPISRLSNDTRYTYMCTVFNGIFNYVYELTERKLINNYLIGNDYHIKFFCDNIAFVNAQNRISFILRCTLASMESAKSNSKFIKQYASILSVAKYILFATNAKLRSDKNKFGEKIKKDEGKKIPHGGICKLKNYKCRMRFIDEAQLHSVFCMQVSAKSPIAYKLLRLIDMFNIPSEPNTFMIHQIFELY